MKRTPVISFLAATVLVLAIFSGEMTLASGPQKRRKAQGASQSSKTKVSPNTLGPSIVSVNGRQIIVSKRNPDGSLAPAAPYIIRGVTWSPASQNTASTIASRRPEFGIWANTDIPLMKTMNVNTVYTFFDPGLDAGGASVLDQLYNNGIMVVMTVDEDGGYDLTQMQQVVNF